MIELLQTEVDVVPGRKATHEVGRSSNSIIVRVTNETDLENLITLSIKCDEPFWRNSWVKLEAEATPNTAPDQKVKEPEYNTDRTAVRVYVPRQSSWDVRVKFEVPMSPLSRAGSYVFKLTALAQHGMEQGIAPAPEEKQGLMVLRPYFDWEVNVDPAEKFVKIWPWRRKAEFQLKVRNKGNDWLYCDLTPPAGNKDLALQLPTQTVAVPPSDLEKEASDRSVPIIARTGVKRIRGERQPLPIQISITRQDAPTVPPMDEAAEMGGGSLNLDSAVTVKPTTETRQTTQAALVFCPPIPSTVQGCLGAVMTNAKQLVMSMIGLFMALQIFSVMLMQYEQNSLSGQVISKQPMSASNDVFTVQGKFIQGAAISVVKKGANEGVEIEDAAAKVEKSAGNKAASDKLQGTLTMGKDTLDRRSFTFHDKTLLGKSGAYVVMGQRGRWFAPIANLLMKPKQFGELKVGMGSVELKATLDQTEGSPGTVVGMTISGQELSEAPSFKIGGTDVKLERAKQDKLRWLFKVPSNLQVTTTGFAMSLNVGSTNIALNEQKFFVKDEGSYSKPESEGSRQVAQSLISPTGNAGAVEKLKKELNKPRPDALALSMKAYLEAREGKADASLKSATAAMKIVRALKPEPKEPKAICLAVVGYLTKDPKYFTQALLESQASPQVHMLKAAYYEQSGKLIQAAEAVEDAIKLMPDSAQLRVAAGYYRYATKSAERAKEHLMAAESSEPGAIRKYAPDVAAELDKLIKSP